MENMSIRRRAKQYHDQIIEKNPQAEAYSFDIAYMIGAESQNKIDIENAVAWIRENWREYVMADADGVVRFGGWESDLRQFMEEN